MTVNKIPHVAIAPPYANYISKCTFCEGTFPVVCVDGDVMYTECTGCGQTGPRISKSPNVDDHSALWCVLATWGWNRQPLWVRCR